jgi:hypothetical protein
MPDFERLHDRRAHHPAAVAEAASRKRGARLNPDDRLMIVAADHPARGALGVRGVADAMADRYDLLRRLVITLERPGVDGVLGTPDIIEDLLLLGALERKIVIGSMNRGGLQGATFELDDRFTGYDAATLDAMGFDGGKMLARIDLSDAYSVATLESCGRAITDLAGRGLMAMIEPFLAHRVNERIVNDDLSPVAVRKSVAVVSGLGATNAYTWLKLPVVDDMKLVMAATTLPALLLGGDPSGDPEHTYAPWKRALDLPGVRGLAVGRALLYPPDGDVAAAVDAAVSLVRSVPA